MLIQIPHRTRPKKMCSPSLFSVVDKSGTSCYHLVTRLMRPTHTQHAAPTSLISSARNKFVATCYEQPVLVMSEQLAASLLPSSTLSTK